MKLIEDGTGAVLEVGGGEDGDAVVWELLRKGGTAVMVLESRYAGGYC